MHFWPCTFFFFQGCAKRQPAVRPTQPTARSHRRPVEADKELLVSDVQERLLEKFVDEQFQNADINSVST